MLAGTREALHVDAGECVRITTGAPLPIGADTVVIKERVRVEGEFVLVEPGEHAQSNVRPAGEDYDAGEVALRAGDRVDRGPARRARFLRSSQTRRFRRGRASR